jgi:hypothetical protein
LIATAVAAVVFMNDLVQPEKKLSFKFWPSLKEHIYEKKGVYPRSSIFQFVHGQWALNKILSLTSKKKSQLSQCP